MQASTSEPNSISHLYRNAIAAMWLGFVVNLLLAVVKLVAGILGHSTAMAADAANSVGDALTSGVTIIALHFAQKPADREHPYGHSQLEGVAALTVAVLIGTSALAIITEAVRSLPRSQEVPPGWVIWIAAGNVILKEMLFRYKLAVSRRTRSQVILAHAWDHRSDALCSAAVLVGLAVVRFGGPKLVWADEVAAIFVACFILFSSVKLYRETASALMDEQCAPEIIKEIHNAAQSTPGVARIETLRARRSGLEVLVDIHVEVDGERTVRDGHHIGHLVQDNIMLKVTGVSHVLVHVEPTGNTQPPHPSAPIANNDGADDRPQ
ncbi:MAG TPA: cation diffusion facilitator family transporter [Phycisphaerae bacterium]|nr:cation diffusion facilitator family transporter [Phycisphaerae bacterium]